MGYCGAACSEELQPVRSPCPWLRAEAKNLVSKGLIGDAILWKSLRRPPQNDRLDDSFGKRLSVSGRRWVASPAQMSCCPVKALHHAPLPQGGHYFKQARGHRLARECHTRGINQKTCLDPFLLCQRTQASFRFREVEGFGTSKPRAEFVEQLG
jgi:hypothetical protein